MRAYAWTHFILSPIQKGIQGGHAITEFRNFFSKVVKSDAQLNAWDDWNDKHKTMIILNGGDCYGLRDVTEKLRTYFNDASFKYPPAGVTFIEDERTLGGLSTSVASIVHARYYIMGAALRKSGVDINDYHFDRGDFTKHEIADHLAVDGVYDFALLLAGVSRFDEISTLFEQFRLGLGFQLSQHGFLAVDNRLKRGLELLDRGLAFVYSNHYGAVVVNGRGFADWHLLWLATGLCQSFVALDQLGIGCLGSLLGAGAGQALPHARRRCLVHCINQPLLDAANFL